MRFAPTTFRPVFGRVLSVIVAVVAAIGIVGLVVTGDVATALGSSWGLVLMAAIAFALFWFPSVRVAEDKITVRNVFSTVHVPWSAIQNVDT
ncbi:MAG: PH domain-containing protein, partial [Salinibacterium sp.]|nr:PH domain-containing protein [Salinibacterium sp.]